MSRRRSQTEDLRLRRLGGPALFTVAICYLVFHVFNGERGLYAYLKQSRNLEASQQELSSLIATRSELENRVRLMGSSSLDLDLLDEQARRILGSARESEIVIILDQPR